MAQQFDYPKSETELRATLDALYAKAMSAQTDGGKPAFTGLVELMTAESTIVTAIHNIKANKGSKTPGADGKTMQKSYLQKPVNWVIGDIRAAFRHFEAGKIRRVFIDKPGKVEKRPLGITTIRDRIVQECIRIVLEPIMEAQFYKHSYGFRPMRDTHMALERIQDYVFKTGYFWIVEGDISKCFDKINHGILIKRLYHMGVQDKRVLQIIKAMLKAGIIDECEINDDGTPQGGILSPLLANVYLDIFDQWLTRQWLEKKTVHPYKSQGSKIAALQKKTSMIPGMLVRYADDFVVVTDSEKHAEWWKSQIRNFLWERMRLCLSEEKTLITDVRRKQIHFLGYEYKLVKGNSKHGYVTRTRPDRNRLRRKFDEINREIKAIPDHYSREQLIEAINGINSKVRGLINYYNNCTWVNPAMKEFSRQMQLTAMRKLKRYKGKWIPARQVQNLTHIHEGYKTKIPAVPYRDIWVGVTNPYFCKWERPSSKNQGETPYSEDGRALYFKRTKKQRKRARLESLMSGKTSELVALGFASKNNNFEYYMNRAYALNRDRMKCRVCGKWLYSYYVCTHRIIPSLPLSKVNKVGNLASMCQECYKIVNRPTLSLNVLEPQARKKAEYFRKQLTTNAKDTA